MSAAAPPRVLELAPVAPAGTPGPPGTAGGTGPALRAVVVDLVAGLAALAVALAPLVALHGGTVAVPVLAAGLGLGAATAGLAAVRRWSTAATVLAVLVVHLVAGGPLAARGTTHGGLVPTAATLRALGPGVLDAPHALLTLTPPLGGDGEVLLTAWVLALVASAAVVSGALRPHAAARTAVVVVPVLAAGAVALLGTADPRPAPAVTGALLAGLLVAGAVARRPRRAPVGGGVGEAARRLVVAGVAVVLAGGAGLAAGGADGARGAGATTAAAGQGTGTRFVLREHVVPPFDLQDRPSPLSSFRALVARDDAVLLRATGLVPGARVRLATLDRYDGTVWGVAGGSSTTGGSGVLRRVASGVPLPAAATAGGPTGAARAVTVQLQAVGLTGVWLPTVGRTVEVTAGAGVDPTALRWDDATGTAVDAGGLAPGDTWTVRALLDPVPEAGAVGSAPAAAIALPAATGVPEALGARAQEVARGAGPPVQVAHALAGWLADEGFFSHGLVAAGDHASSPGHGAARLTDLVAGPLMVGDDEQYAAAMALMARRVGLPSRVVVGFVPADGSASADGVVELRGSDVHAWVEVALEGWGWVPFDPTPPRERTPQEDRTSRPDEAQPQVLQPPPAPPAAAPAPEDDTEQPHTERRDEPVPSGPSWRRVAVATAAVGTPVALLLGPPLLVVGAKARRRRRRRGGPDPVRRVADAWQELLDRARDLGHAPAPSATRTEAADALVAAVLARAGRRAAGPGAAQAAAALHAGARGLARTADAHVFAPGTPTPSQADAAWAEADAVLRALDAVLPPLRRLRARATPASLRRPGRARTPRAPGTSRATRTPRPLRTPVTPGAHR